MKEALTIKVTPSAVYVRRGRRWRQASIETIQEAIDKLEILKSEYLPIKKEQDEKELSTNSMQAPSTRVEITWKYCNAH